MRARNLLMLLAVAVVALGVVRSSPADIPAGVDYHAVYDASGWHTVIDKYGYGNPIWETETDLFVYNIRVEEWIKLFWVEVDYLGDPPAPPPDIGVTAPGSTVTPLGVTAGAQSLTWLFMIIPQPDSETVHFPDASFRNLEGIDRIEVGAYCNVPEPATIGLLASSGLMLVLLRRRKA